MNDELIRIQLETCLQRLRLRLRLVEGIRLGAWGTGVGLAVALGLSILARLVPLAPASLVAFIGLGLGLAGALVGLIAAWIRPRPLVLVARLADRRMDLRARLATAWAVASGELSAEYEREVVQAQLADALLAARGLDTRSAFPLRLSRLQGAAVFALTSALALVVLLPNPQDAVLAHQAAIHQQVTEQIAELEELRAELAQFEELSETQTGRQVLAVLEELEQALAQGDLSQEEALAALSEAEASLSRLQNQSAAAQQAAIQEAGRRMEQAASTELNQALADALAHGDVDLVANILANLANEEGEALTREEELALAEALETAAESLANSDPQLAGSLAQAAQAIRDGDAGAARQALSEASEQMSQTRDELQAQQAASQAVERVQQGRQGMAGVGGQGEGGEAGQGGQQGQDGQPGQGQPGSGTGVSSVAGPGAAGSGSGSGDPGQAGEAGGSSGQVPSDNNPGQGLERVYEPVYAPQFLGGEGGEVVTLPDTGDPGEGIRPLPGQSVVPGEARVPYDAVYATYRDAAAEALGESFIPLGMREVVRQYFSSLEP